MTELHIEDYAEPKAKNNKQRKIELLKLMGNKCVRCGFHDLRALQIDHINGDGAIERASWKEFGGMALSQFYSLVSKSFSSGENRYQLLCANCNWIKRSENREFPHKRLGVMRSVRTRAPRNF